MNLKSTAGPSHLPSSSHPSGRKRVREAIANGDAMSGFRDTVMGDDDDEEYFDVEMDTDAPGFASSSSGSAPEFSGNFVPYYSHFGGSDFDDEYVISATCLVPRFSMLLF